VLTGPARLPSPKNILYIKRAEENHTKEYIIDKFSSNMCGKVSDVKFIEKHGVNGQKYFGAIVYFESWFTNSNNERLLQEMNTSENGTAKFFHDTYNRKFWHVMIHKEKEQYKQNESVLSKLDESLDDKERANKLEEIVKTLEAQLILQKMNCQRQEIEITNLQHEIDMHNLRNNNLIYEHNLEIEEKNKEIEMWKTLTNNAHELFEYEKEEKEKVELEYRDNESIINYLQNEMEDMRKLVLAFQDKKTK
jgi:hypothetical protein